MGVTEIDEFLKIVPAVRRTSNRYLWTSYDAEADVLYINFKKSSRATDSGMTEDDVIVRYGNDEVVGMTVLHTRKRKARMGCAIKNSSCTIKFLGFK